MLSQFRLGRVQSMWPDTFRPQNLEVFLRRAVWFFVIAECFHLLLFAAGIAFGVLGWVRGWF